MKISVIESNNHKIGSIFEPGFIVTYEEDGEVWKVLNSFENKVYNAKGIAAVRIAVEDTIKQLDDVKIVVASEIPGIASGIFEAVGFEIFLVKKNVFDVLDAVKKEILELIEEQKKKPSEFNITQFLEPGMNKGDLCLNMEKILSKNPQLTSKKILLPYLKTGKFNSLNVICSHIPKWFTTDLNALGFEYEIVNSLPNEKTVKIVHVKNISIL